jgi:hypothetical protein
MSTTIHPTHTSATTTSRASSNHPAPDSPYANGHHHHHHHDAGAGHLPGSVSMAKKGKQKKVADNSEASKLIAAKISQLELDAAGEKDQEAEIGGFGFFPFPVPQETLARKWHGSSKLSGVNREPTLGWPAAASLELDTQLSPRCPLSLLAASIACLKTLWPS